MEAAISCNFHCSRLERHWSGYWPDVDPHGLTADIKERLAAARAAWGLSDLEPLDGGVVALTLAATQGGRPVVLKLNPRGHRDDAQLASEGDALAFWRHTGAAAELIDRRDEGFTLLIERLEPGQALDDAGLSPEERLTELGRLAARLHGAGPPPPEPFLHVRDFLAGPLPDGDDVVLVHLDLHGGNALRSGSSWKAIDPKGVRADRHADVWALIDPVMLEQLPHDADRHGGALGGRLLARGANGSREGSRVGAPARRRRGARGRRPSLGGRAAADGRRARVTGAAGRLSNGMAEPFRHRLRVRWSECDLQGVVFYPNYLAYFDHLLTELWREAVGPYGEIHRLGIDLVVAEASVRYRASARFDDEIDIVAAISRLGTTSMTTDFRIERVEDGALLAEGDLRHVFVDPDSLEKRQMPEAVRERLSRFAPAAPAIP